MSPRSSSRWSATPVRRQINLVAAALALAFLLPHAARAQTSDLIEEHFYLRTNIKGQTVRLEAMVMKRADARGRLPILFYNHNRPGNYSGALEKTFEGESRAIAHDFAHRGWLAVAIARRGFGRSDGALQADTAATCNDNFAKSVFNADADDIEATLAAITSRPDADPTRIVTMGHSGGGGTSIELGARNLPGFIASINISGGYSKGDTNGVATCEVDKVIAKDFRDLGARSRINNLWIFADNDERHPPAEVELMRSSFAAGGGTVKVVSLGTIGVDGHNDMLSSNPRSKWLHEIDAFFRAQNLPTWGKSNVDAVMQRLRLNDTPKFRTFIEQYFGLPSETAMARSNSGSISYSSGATIAAARANAVRGCEQQSPPPCTVVMENDRFVSN